MSNSKDAACRYRTRAKQLRALAEQVDDEESRKLLLIVADEYDDMAERNSGQ
jgi:hypothetical protein